MNKEIKNKLEETLSKIREETIKEKLELLERFDYPEPIYSSIKWSLWKKLRDYSGSKFDEYMDRYLRLR